MIVTIDLCLKQIFKNQSRKHISISKHEKSRTIENTTQAIFCSLEKNIVLIVFPTQWAKIKKVCRDLVNVFNISCFYKTSKYFLNNNCVIFNELFSCYLFLTCRIEYLWGNRSSISADIITPRWTLPNQILLSDFKQ